MSQSIENIFVHDLWIYPVKSAKGFSLKEIYIGQWGPLFDRRWMVVNGKGEFLTQRECPQMALLETSIKRESLCLSYEMIGQIEVPLENRKGKDVWVQVWKDRLKAKDCGDEVSHFLSKAFGQEYRLVFMPDSTQRKVEGTLTKTFSFCDSSPLLVLSLESLEDLNARIQKKLLIDRFRPNIVVSGGEAYGEDDWDEYKMGEVVLKNLRPCTRCKVTTVNQQKGVFEGKSPLKDLAKYRSRGGGLVFGQSAYHLGQGKIRIGDPLDILKRKSF